jgi:hypothetical protein
MLAVQTEHRQLWHRTEDEIYGVHPDGAVAEVSQRTVNSSEREERSTIVREVMRWKMDKTFDQRLRVLRKMPATGRGSEKPSSLT